MISETDRLHLAEAIPSPWQNSIFQVKESTKQSQSIPTEIKFPNPPGTTSVEVCGNWDEWRTRTILEFFSSENIWHCFISLPVGIYQCKFLVNGVYWVVTNMLPMLTDEGGNNNNQIFVKDINDKITEIDVAATGIGDKPETVSSVEPPPIYKMYFSEAHMRHREFTPSPSPEQSSMNFDQCISVDSKEIHYDHSSVPIDDHEGEQIHLNEITAQQARIQQSTNNKQACTGKCTIL
ncbi:putative Glycogen recognition site of AMP-activated protein kinase [Monocercomonoides exilis]|uniref:putative Glycogen recognition site of AMP-activated protein kinase n=1 Tax=Monocercomonoides exilis TaxID=2049356 RepID=UPI003559529E|nr:putative Glycogen recognition site of AMP-activated protein kinase [Monocercomonoides exilis]|eukprot:MONOS_10561.1-p1 / transcript=MONOS_10561.1 / gene=MONOS_10561 / organism=Monocercomonoides_exilis_PA203 / gene_product=unspecified product / transcript_product=unspecified product / location=Mono_scaffold00485:14065-14772(-) / protein_length=236 / sequence_SO=supercontig / SO=protein_coding / is_pseudo=false